MIIRDRGEEVEFLDITELIYDIDWHVGDHLKIVLSDFTYESSKDKDLLSSKNAATLLSKQDYELINFIIARAGYAKSSQFFDQVKEEFCVSVVGVSPKTNTLLFGKSEAEVKKECDDKKIKALTNLLYKDIDNEDKETKRLQDYARSHGVNNALLNRLEIRELFLSWLNLRKTYNKEYEIKQLDENWGIWLRKHSEPLTQYAYQKMGEEERSLDQLKTQFYEEFQKFRKEMLFSLKNNEGKGFIQNPAYLVLKAWRYLSIDKDKALKFLEDAIKIDREYSWTASNARANIKLMRDGAGIYSVDLKNEDEVKKIQEIISSYYQDIGDAISSIENVVIPSFEHMLSFLMIHEKAKYGSELFVQLVVSIETYKEVAARLRKNQEVILASSEPGKVKMIRVKDAPSLLDITKDIDYAAAMIRERDKRSELTSVGEEAFEKRSTPEDMDRVDPKHIEASRDFVTSQIAVAGGIIIDIEAYEVEQEKDWFGTIVSGVMGIAFIVIGAILAPVGGVFISAMAVSLVAKGIGDILSTGISLYKGAPIDVNGYLKSTAISIGISIAVAGILQVVDSIANVAVSAVDAAKDTGWSISSSMQKIAKAAENLNKNPVGYIARTAGWQAGITLASMGAYELTRRTVEPEDVRGKAEDAINGIISRYREQLRKIFISELSGSLNERIGKITNEYCEKFEDTGTQVGVGIATSTAGYLLDGMPSPIGLGGVLKSGVDVTLGLVKNARAIPDIVADTEGSIRELFASSLTSGTMFEQILTREYGDDGKNIFLAVKEQNYITNSEIPYSSCDQLDGVDLTSIQFSGDLGTDFDYEQTMKNTCWDVGKRFLGNYDGYYNLLKDNFIGLVTGTITHIRKQNIVKPITDFAVQTPVSFARWMNEERKNLKAEEAKAKTKTMAELQAKIEQTELVNDLLQFNPEDIVGSISDAFGFGKENEQQGERKNTNINTDDSNLAIRKSLQDVWENVVGNARQDGVERLQQIEIKVEDRFSEVAKYLSGKVDGVVTADELAELNGVQDNQNDKTIQPGRRLWIPAPKDQSVDMTEYYRDKMWDDFFGLAGKSSGNVFSSLDASLLDTCEAPIFSGNVFDDGDRFSKYFQYNAYYDRIPSSKSGDFSIKQIEWMKQYNIPSVQKLNEEYKQKGSPYEMILDPSQIEGIELGYVVIRPLNKPEVFRKGEYDPMPGLDKTTAMHKGLWFPWGEGGQGTPGDSILSYSDDSQVKYAGGEEGRYVDDNNPLRGVFRGFIDPKEMYRKESVGGKLSRSPIGYADVSFDAVKMEEAIRIAEPKWNACGDYSMLDLIFLPPEEGHQCRGFVSKAAMNEYIKMGGRLYLIPTEKPYGSPRP